MDNSIPQSLLGKTNLLIRKFAVALFIGLHFSAHICSAQWVRSDNGIAGGNIRSLAVSGTTIFAGLNSFENGLNASGVFSSTNNGTSWAPVNTSANTGIVNVSSITCLLVNGTNLFAGGNGGVYRSGDNGATWTLANTGITNSIITSLAAIGTNLFVGTQAGVFLSTNNGTGWTAVNTGLTNTNVLSLGVSGTNLFAGTGGGVFLSTNNGTSWASANIGITGAVASFAVLGTNLFAGTQSNGVFLSTDNGTSWTSVSTGLTNVQINSLLATSGGDLYAGTNGGGVFRSTNLGTTWASANSGVTNLNINALAVIGTNFFAGTPTGVFLSPNNGTTWTLASTGINTILRTSAIIGTNTFVGVNGGVFLSTNNGANWVGVNNGLTNNDVFALAVSGTNLFVGTGQGVFLSTNNGTNWTSVGAMTNFTVSALAIDGSNIYAGTNGSGVYLSTNNGTSFTLISPSLNVSCLLVNGANLFAGTLVGGVQLYNGSSWAAVTTGLQSNNISSLAINGSTLYAGTRGGGVHFSTNNGTNWTPINTGLANLRVHSILVNGTTLFAGAGNGPHAFTTNGTQWGEVSTGLPAINSTTWLAVSGTNLLAGIVSAGVWSRPLSQIIPQVSSFSPSIGTVGTTVTITGTNFSTTPANNVVMFNGTLAAVTASTATSITTTVPSGATTGLISVEVNSLLATSASNFTVIQPPTITSFTPASGPVGTMVTITGTNFSTTPANNTVNFNGTAATVTASTATSITTTVPVGATTGPITVTVNALTATSASSFTLPDITKPIVNNTTSTTVAPGTPLSIAVALTDAESGIVSANLLYRSVAEGGNFITVALTAGAAPNYSQSIAATAIGELGVEYKFVVTNGAGLINDEIIYLTKVSITGSGVVIPYASAGSEVANYRIVSVPLDLTAKTVGDVFNELGPLNDTQWRMSCYQNGASADLNLSSPIDPGKGYWLIAKNDPGVIQSGAGVSVTASTATPFEIDLVAGWNQLGNPYNFNLNWADVQAANSGLPGLRKYDGTFTDATVLNKMEGGFVNVTAARKISVPVAKNTSVNGRLAQEGHPYQNRISEKNWQVYIELAQGKLKNKIAGFGMHEKASEGYDVFDGLTMPRFFGSWLEVNHTKKSEGGFLSKDIVPTSANKIWEFSIETSEEDPAMTFAWDNSYFGSNGSELYLWDVAQQLGVDMRTEDGYIFSKNTSRSFKVLFGSSDFVKSEMRVTDLMLYAAWPDPASEEDEVTISFSVPESTVGEVINIGVFDMLGRKVLNNEAHYTSGYYEVKWRRTEKETSGLYMVTLRVGKILKQIRVVLR